MKKCLFIPILLVLISTQALSSSRYDIDKLMDMSIEELVNLTFTSASKREEKAFEVTSSIFVLTADDIRRTGASSIPEALRLVPGLQVAKSGSSDWAISSRGFNSGFANKLLVLVDGRSVYTPLFSGVYWDTIDYPLEDIERIEVIKGSGATLWGANAVNGVINIITKKAGDTQGSYVKAVAGNYEKGTVTTRHGGKIENGFYRAYGKFTARDNSEFSDTKINDDWKMGRGGFRIDKTPTKGNEFTLQGDVYSGVKERELQLPELAPPFVSFQEDKEKLTGANILANWKKDISNKSAISIQGYVDYTRRDLDQLDQEILTADIEFQHTWSRIKNHEIIWGVGARTIYDNLEGSFYVNYSPDSETRVQGNSFIQDKITLLPNKLFLTLGTKLEWNEYTNFEIQPSAKLGWNINNDNFFWASVGRAIRTPNRSINDIYLASQGTPFGMVALVGKEETDSAELLSYELGYRYKYKDKFYLDASLYFNDYKNIVTNSIGTPAIINGVPTIPVYPSNQGSGETYGLELSADLQVNDNWKIITSYSYINFDIEYGAAMADTETIPPTHQFNIRSHLNFAENWELDNVLYYMDKIASGNNEIDNYVRFDTRIAYKPNKNWEFSIVGQNLFDDWHQEFFPFQYQPSAEVGRSVYGSVVWKF